MEIMLVFILVMVRVIGFSVAPWSFGMIIKNLQVKCDLIGNGTHIHLKETFRVNGTENDGGILSSKLGLSS